MLKIFTLCLVLVLFALPTISGWYVDDEPAWDIYVLSNRAIQIALALYVVSLMKVSFERWLAISVAVIALALFVTYMGEIILDKPVLPNLDRDIVHDGYIR